MSRRPLAKSQAKPKTPRTTVTLDPDAYERVLRMAKAKKVSAAWIIRDAVDKYLSSDIPLLAHVNGRNS